MASKDVNFYYSPFKKAMKHIICSILWLAAFSIAHSINIYPRGFEQSRMRFFTSKMLEDEAESNRRHSCGYTNFEESIDDARKSLENFNECLKTFIHDIYFDHNEFDRHLGILGYKLDHLAHIVDPFGHDSQLSLQLGFSKHVYGCMKNVATYMKKFQLKQDIDYLLAKNALQLNLSLLSLCNSDGSPKTTSVGFTESVERLRINLHHWKEVYDHSPSTSASARRVFIQQYRDIEWVLKVFQNAL